MECFLTSGLHPNETLTHLDWTPIGFWIYEQTRILWSNNKKPEYCHGLLGAKTRERESRRKGRLKIKQEDGSSDREGNASPRLPKPFPKGLYLSTETSRSKHIGLPGDLQTHILEKYKIYLGGSKNSGPWPAHKQVKPRKRGGEWMRPRARHCSWRPLKGSESSQMVPSRFFIFRRDHFRAGVHKQGGFITLRWQTNKKKQKNEQITFQCNV